jgi:hypothetical protein
MIYPLFLFDIFSLVPFFIKKKTMSESSSSASGAKAAYASSLFCVERIVLAIDLTKEMASTEFDTASEISSPNNTNSNTLSNLTRLKVLQDSLATFVLAKSEMNAGHEFAICTLQADLRVRWVLDFSSNVAQVLDALYSLEVGADYRPFDVAHLLRAVASRCPDVLHFPSATRVPDRTVRLILAFGRSYTVPVCSDLPLRDRLVASRAFFFDTLYLHGKASKGDGAIPQEIYDFFIFCCTQASTATAAASAASGTSAPAAADPTASGGKSAYVFECTAKASRLHSYVCKLLAHPLQRDNDQDFTIGGT